MLRGNVRQRKKALEKNYAAEKPTKRQIKGFGHPVALVAVATSCRSKFVGD